LETLEFGVSMGTLYSITENIFIGNPLMLTKLHLKDHFAYWADFALFLHVSPIYLEVKPPYGIAVIYPHVWSD